MGAGFKYICKKCNNDKTFFLGVGMRFFPDYLINRKEILSICDSDNLLNIKELETFLNDKKDIDFDGSFGNEMFECESCHNVFCKFDFKLKSSDGSFIPKYDCDNCHSEVKLLEWPPDKIKCDKCDGEMDKGSMLMWD